MPECRLLMGCRKEINTQWEYTSVCQDYHLGMTHLLLLVYGALQGTFTYCKHSLVKWLAVYSLIIEVIESQKDYAAQSIYSQSTLYVTCKMIIGSLTHWGFVINWNLFFKSYIRPGSCRNKKTANLAIGHRKMFCFQKA